MSNCYNQDCNSFINPCNDDCNSLCNSTTCPPCSEYDNCGCLNPTTFDCVTYTGSNLGCIGAERGDSGNSVLSLINNRLCDVGKVKIDSTDNCPEPLTEKIKPGLNISITKVGEGCDAYLRIDSTSGGVPVDVNVKVSPGDTTTGYLYNKVNTGQFLVKSIQTPGGNEKLLIDVVPATLISSDPNNPIHIGSDGKLKCYCVKPDGSETIIVAGTGVQVSGSGTITSPYVISTNPSIQVARPCFDGIWKDITMSPTGNPNVTHLSGIPQFRYRFDGTIEFRGSAIYKVDFGNNVSSNRKFTIPCGSIPVTCITVSEQAGSSDLKSITYIENAGQMYNYIIRKINQNIILEFQSSFINSTSKTISVNFEGAVSYPNI